MAAEPGGIAPTVFTETTGGVRKDNLKVHAEALGPGLEKEATAKLKQYETQAKALGAAIREKGGGTMPTVSVVRFIAGPTRLYQTHSHSGVVLTTSASSGRSPRSPTAPRSP